MGSIGGHGSGSYGNFHHEYGAGANILGVFPNSTPFIRYADVSRAGLLISDRRASLGDKIINAAECLHSMLKAGLIFAGETEVARIACLRRELSGIRN